MTNKIKIGCWNIGSMVSNTEENLKLVLEILSEYKPDIMCFQEFPNSEEIRKKIIEAGGFPFHTYFECSVCHVSSEWNMGLFICSKFELADTSVYELIKPSIRIFYKGNKDCEEYWHSKFFLKTGLNLNGKSISLFTGHSFPFYRYNLEEEDFGFVFEGIDNWVTESANGQTYIIAADFNSRNPIKLMPHIASDHYDIFDGEATRPSGRKTDAIIIPSTAKVQQKMNISTTFDHNFIMAILSDF